MNAEAEAVGIIGLAVIALAFVVLVVGVLVTNRLK